MYFWCLFIFYHLQTWVQAHKHLWLVKLMWYVLFLMYLKIVPMDVFGMHRHIYLCYLSAHTDWQTATVGLFGGNQTGNVIVGILWTKIGVCMLCIIKKTNQLKIHSNRIVNLRLRNLFFLFCLFFVSLTHFCFYFTAEGWDICCRRIHASSALQDDHPLHCVWHHAGRNSHPQRYIPFVCMCVDNWAWIEIACVFMCVQLGLYGACVPLCGRSNRRSFTTCVWMWLYESVTVTL